MLQRHFMRFNKLIASNNIPSLRPATKIDSHFNKNIIATQQQHGLLYNNINVCVFVWVLRATPHIWCVIHFSSCFAAYYAVAIMNTHTHNITICLVIFFSCFFTTAFRFFNSREYHVFLSFFFLSFFCFYRIYFWLFCSEVSCFLCECIHFILWFHSLLIYSVIY